MPDQTYRLLYEIATSGLDKLDGIPAAQQKINLETRFSAQQLKTFEEMLRVSSSSGNTYTQALKGIAQSTNDNVKAYSGIARALLDNDRAQQASTRAAEQACRDRIRAAEQEERAWRRVQAAHEAALKENERRSAGFLEQNERPITSGIRTASVLAGVHNTRSIDATLGAVGGPIGIAGMIGTLAVGGAYNLVKDTANDARQLQNLANEFGLTAQQAFKLDSAAKIAGEDLNGLGRLAVRLAEALENPATTGKKTADELVKAGIDIRQGTGVALQQTLEYLANIPDAGKRATEATVLFGAQGPKIAEVAGAIKEVNQNLDEMTQRKLLEANTALTKFGINAKLVFGEVAASLVTGMQKIQKWSDALDAMTGATLETNAGYQAWTRPELERLNKERRDKFKPGAPLPGVLDPPDLAAANRIANRYQDQGLALDERISAAHKAATEARTKYDQSVTQARGNPDSVANKDLQTEAQKVKDLELAYKKLADQKKATNRAPGIESGFQMERSRLLAGMQEAEDSGQGNGRLPQLERQYQNTLATINRGTNGYTTRQRLELQGYALNTRNILQDQERRRLSNEEIQRQAKYDAVGNAFSDFAPGYDAKRLDAFYLPGLKDSITEANKGFAADREIASMNRSASVESLRRSVGFQDRLAQMANEGRETPGTIGQGLQGQLQIIQAEAAMKKQDVEASAHLYSDEQKRVELFKVERDLRKETADAELQATEKYIQMRYQAQQKNRQETGDFLSGLVNAGIDGHTGDYFRNIGRSTLSTVVGNFGKNLPFSLNSALSLGRTGALGTEDKPNFLGKLLEGLPLGFDHGSGANSLQSTNEKLRSATVDLTNTMRAMIGAPSLPGGSGGSVSLSAPSGGGGFGFPGFGGIPGLSGVTGTPPFLPSFLSNPGDGLPIDAGPGYRLPGISGGSSSTSSTSALSQIFGGLGSTVGNGQGLSALFKGSADLGGGVGHAFSGLERLGAGIGVGGTAAGGLFGALSGFKSGGGRGISAGIGSILGSAAALDPEPLSKTVLSIGGAISGLISSIFKDPKQARQEEMQKSMINSAFVLPSSNEVTASYGGYSSGGFNYGAGGMVQSANQNTVAPVTIHINAVDSKSLTDLFMANPDAMGKGLLYGLQSGSANAFVTEMQLRGGAGSGWS